MVMDYSEDYRTPLILRVVPTPSYTPNPFPNLNPSSNPNPKRINM